MTDVERTPKLLPIEAVKDERGVLCFMQYGEYLPFQPQRTFWITDVPEGEERGGHAHRTCQEFVVAVRGSFVVECYDGNTMQTFSLSQDEYKGLLIPAGVWCRLHNFTADALCLVVASEPYDVVGYIHDKVAFEAYVDRGGTL